MSNVGRISSQNKLVAGRAVQTVGDVAPEFALYWGGLALPDIAILARLCVGGVGVVGRTSCHAIPDCIVASNVE